MKILRYLLIGMVLISLAMLSTGCACLDIPCIPLI